MKVEINSKRKATKIMAREEVLHLTKMAKEVRSPSGTQVRYLTKMAKEVKY